MEYLEILPTPIFKKILDYIPDSYINQCIDYIKQQPSHTNDPNSSSDTLTYNQQLLNAPLFTPLTKEIIKYSLLYSKKLEIDVNGLQISNSWGYIVNKNNKINNYHAHCNSLLSGVMYLTPGSPISFASSFFDDLFLKAPQKYPEESKLHFNEVPINKKQLILFPSHLHHSITPHTLNNERICIAFNIIPKGEYGPHYGKLYL
jgi:uncharacterized protein (TIGR02466 family)